MSEISNVNVYRSVDIIRHRLASLMYIDQLTLQRHRNVRDLTRWLRTHVCTTDLNYWIKLLSCIIEANGGHIGLSHINVHWYY